MQFSLIILVLLRTQNKIYKFRSEYRCHGYVGKSYCKYFQCKTIVFSGQRNANGNSEQLSVKGKFLIPFFMKSQRLRQLSALIMTKKFLLGCIVIRKLQTFLTSEYWKIPKKLLYIFVKFTKRYILKVYMTDFFYLLDRFLVRCWFQHEEVCFRNLYFFRRVLAV